MENGNEARCLSSKLNVPRLFGQVSLKFHKFHVSQMMSQRYLVECGVRSGVFSLMVGYSCRSEVLVKKGGNRARETIGDREGWPQGFSSTCDRRSSRGVDHPCVVSALPRLASNFDEEIVSFTSDIWKPEKSRRSIANSSRSMSSRVLFPCCAVTVCAMPTEKHRPQAKQSRRA